MMLHILSRIDAKFPNLKSEALLLGVRPNNNPAHYQHFLLIKGRSRKPPKNKIASFILVCSNLVAKNNKHRFQFCLKEFAFKMSQILFYY